MKRTIPVQMLKFSRKLRQDQTPWEDKLWYYLRAKRFYGLKFKRQVQIGKYIVDFCCRSLRLIIEIDGGQHGETLVREYDLVKDAFLIEQGYKVLHFWNNDLDDNLEGVLETIRQACLTSLPTSPLKRGEETLL